MKIFVFDNNHSPVVPGLPPVWHFLADSSLANMGKPFFVPGFADTFHAVPVMALRICKLGKSVEPRFARRYYSEIVPAIHFKAPELEKRLLTAGLSPDMARSFDSSLIAGLPMEPEAALESRLTLRRNGQDALLFSPNLLSLEPDTVISLISKSNTLKMGDLVIPGMPEGIEIKIGDNLELMAGDERVLSVRVR